MVMVFLASVSVLPILDFLRVFWLNVFPESRLVLLFVIFTGCVIKARETDGVKYVIGAILSALIAIGYKETSFILCLVFPVTMLIWDYKGCGRSFRAMCYVFLVIGISYTIFYFGYWARGIERSYNENRTVPLIDSLKFYMSIPMILASFFLGAYRGVRVCFFRARSNLIYDALLFSALAVVSAYIMMGIVEKYYVMPVQFVLFVVFLFWLFRLCSYRRWLGVLSFGFLMCIVWSTVQSTIKHWKWSMEKRSQDMSFVQALAADKAVSRVYYCRSDGVGENYREHVFRSYFRYAGGNEKICRSAISFDGTLSTNEVAVFSFHDPGWRGKGEKLAHAGSKSIRSSWYVAVYGSASTAARKTTDASTLLLDCCDDDACFRSFYSAEGDGRWGKGNSGLIVKIPERLRGKDLNAQLDVGGTRGKHKEANRLVVSVGGKPLAETELGWKQVVVFTIPGMLTNRDELDIGLKTVYAVCPKRDGINSDNRELGVFFRCLALKSAEVKQGKESTHE